MTRTLDDEADTTQAPPSAEPGIAVPRSVVLLVAAPVVVMIAYLALLQVPKAALELPMQTSAAPNALTQLAPQGWAFFTKSPRGETMRVFERDGADVVDASAFPLAKPSNWFGLDRRPRAQGTEYATLTSSQPESSWTDCTDFASCTDPALQAHEVDNPVGNPSFCGDIYVVGYIATPWAWREFDYQPREPERSLRLDVAC